MADPFELLRVGYDADTGQLRAAYRNQARHLHPDTGGNANEFVLLNDAYTRATAIRRAQRPQADTPPRQPTANDASTHENAAPPSTEPADDWLTELQSWFRPWVLITLTTQVIALSVIALGQPERPGLAVAASLLLGPLAATAFYLAAVLAGPRIKRLHHSTGIGSE